MWPFSKSLGDVISQTKMVKAGGVKFKIKKLNVLNHIEGLNVLIKTYSTYEDKKISEKMDKEMSGALDKVKKVYRDVFLSSVIWPKLSASPDKEGQFVDDLFDDWQLCHDLYSEIMQFTNKKKAKFHMWPSLSSVK